MDDRRRRDAPRDSYSNGYHHRNSSQSQSQSSNAPRYPRPPPPPPPSSYHRDRGPPPRKRRSPSLNPSNDFKRSVRPFDYERSSALNYDDDWPPYSSRYHDRPPPSAASSSRDAYHGRPRDAPSGSGRDRSPPSVRPPRPPAPPPPREYRSLPQEPFAPEAPSERVLYEQGFPVDLSYGDEDRPAPLARPTSNGAHEAPPHTPRAPSTYTRSRTPSLSKLASPAQATYKSPVAPLKSPTIVLQSPGRPPQPPTPVPPAQDEIEEGEDIDMPDKPPPMPPAATMDGLQMDGVPSTLPSEPIRADSPMEARPEPEQPLELPAVVETAETAVEAVMADLPVAEPALEEAPKEAPKEPPPQAEAIVEEAPEAPVKEEEPPVEKAPSPMPDSFEELLEQLASRYKADDMFKLVLGEVPPKPADATPERRPIADITNTCYLPSGETLQADAQLHGFLGADFAARMAEAGERARRLRAEYKGWNKPWRAHVARMEQHRARHARRLDVPAHNGQLHHAHPSLGANFRHGSISASQGAASVPQTPGGGGGAGADAHAGPAGFFDSAPSPHQSTSAFGVPPVTTPGGLPSGRPSRRAAGAGFAADTVHSEAEFQDVIERLKDAEALDPAARAARSAAALPEQLPEADVERLVLAFRNLNHLVPDAPEHYGIGPAAAARSDPCAAEWTDAEVDEFCARFAQAPKQFGKIAAGLPGKTLQQCVLFYYRLKDAVDFRALTARRPGAGRGRKPKLQPANQGSSLLAAMRPAVAAPDEEEEEEPAAAARKPAPIAYAYEKLLGSVRDDNEGEGSAGVGYAATRRLLYGGNKRAEAEQARQRRAQARAQAQEAQEALQEAAARAGPSDGTMAAAEVLAALQVGPTEATPDTEQEGDDAARLEAALLGRSGAAQPQAPKRKSTTSSYWSVTEKTEFKRLLALHGKDFAAIGVGLGSKTAVQCRNYFANNRIKAGLEEVADGAEARLLSGQRDLPAEEDGVPLASASELGTGTQRDDFPPPLNALTREPPRGYFSTSAASSVHEEGMPGAAPRPPPLRSASAMKINDLLNADEGSGTPGGSVDQDWFESEAKDHDRTDDLTDEDPDLPTRRHDSYRPSYAPQQPAYYDPARYDHQRSVHPFSAQPFGYDAYNAWPPQHPQLPPPASFPAPPPPPHGGYHDRGYYSAQPFPPYGAYRPPPGPSYDQRGR